MRIAFVVNDIQTEKENFTTIRLARRAVARGDDVYFIGLADFCYGRDGIVAALSRAPHKCDYDSDKDFLAHLKALSPGRVRLIPSEVDILMLRADPADELHARPWAPTSGLLFAQLAGRSGVLVLNDPRHLTDAANKTYFQTYPEAIRPRTCITMIREEIMKFVEEEGGKAVIKPLQGSGGRGVFIITEESRPNLNQMIDATIKEGYAIVQEYLPRAANGDLRLITLNGKPLVVDGVYACLRRYNDQGDGRSNISAGGKYEIYEPDEDALRLAEIAGPKLARDGMYLAGLDIVGDKMMEVNVDTPGGITMLDDLSDKDFSGAILDDLAKKVRMREHYRGREESIPFAVV